MSVFDDNITNRHPFDGITKMEPKDALDYVFNVLTGEDFNNTIYQYKRYVSEGGLDGIIKDMKNTISVVEQFHPNIIVKFQLSSRTYAQKHYQSADGTTRKEFPDEQPVFIMYFLTWVIESKSKIKIKI